jgi:hypothetical protein
VPPRTPEIIGNVSDLADGLSSDEVGSTVDWCGRRDRFGGGGICGSGRPRSRGRNSQQGSNRDARQSGMEEQDRQTEQDPDADKNVPEKFHAS